MAAAEEGRLPIRQWEGRAVPARGGRGREGRGEGRRAGGSGVQLSR